jgi:hypothetical protein
LDTTELWFKTSASGQQQILDGGTAFAGIGQAFEVGLTQSGGVGGSPFGEHARGLRGPLVERRLPARADPGGRQAVCPPVGVPGTPANPNYGNWNGNLVTELDHSNPIMGL